jgi:phosphoglycerate dehydrogenase-like enzyme
MVTWIMEKDPGPKITAAFCGNEPWQIERVFGQGRRARLESLAGVFPTLITDKDFARLEPSLQDVEAIFSTWGMDHGLAMRILGLPKLKAFFYAAGTLRHFARPLLDRNIVVVSAWAANAVPVAQFTMSQILLSLKGYFRNVREARMPANHGLAVAVETPGVLGAVVALLGCGMVGRTVADLLRPFDLEIIAYDPFLSDADAAAMGIRKVTLEEAFASAHVVSNHLADLPPTRGLLAGSLFASMRKGATFINTGRGATIAESDLAETLRQRSDLTALLDVVSPEPPAPDSPWYELGNVLLSSHIAGSQGNEVVRMADYCLEEYLSWREGRPLRFQVTPEKLENMA